MTIYVQVHSLIHLLPKLKPSIVHVKTTLEQRKYIQSFCLNQLKAKFALQVPIIEKNQYGKPILSNYPHIHFNQSHSQQYYALVMSNEICDLGVDIEDITREINMNALALRYFHSDEMTIWQQSGHSKIAWLKIWTAKEAVLKAHGLGIRLALNTLNTCQNLTLGMVTHPQLGCFCYHQFEKEHFILSIAYRCYKDNANFEWLND